jgi:hypothetical protein
MFKNRCDSSTWLFLFCSVALSLSVVPASADQPDEPVGWEVLSNGLIEVQYDRSGDGVPDRVALHQIVRSGWTIQPIQEIEAQARAEKQWIFIVEYDQDRFVYLTNTAPLFWADDQAQRGDWTALPVDSPGRAPTDETSTCPVCMR